jgi:membrane fusion protein, multidrug efflux system
MTRARSKFARSRGRGALALALWTILAALAAAPLSACKGSSKAETKAEELKTVRIELVGREDIDDILNYPADLKPMAEVRVYSRVPDRILSFPWNDGDEIKRGNRVAVIRNEGVSQGMEQVAAQMDALDVQIENQEAELKRLDLLLSSGAIAQAEHDRLTSAIRAAKAQRRAMSAGKGQLATAASDGVIQAAISGIIADKMFEVGDMAAPGAPLCRIISVDELKVELRLVETDVPRVSKGLGATLYLDAHPGRTFAGTVTNVLPYLDQRTRTNTVEVKVANPKDANTGQRLLKPGMFGRAELVVAHRAGVVVAPEPALLLDNRILEQQKPGETLRKAFVVDAEGVARQRLLKLGARKGSHYEVIEGLSQGERLIVRGQHGLRDGQKVQIVEAARQ